jgi:hypothetical protein
MFLEEISAIVSQCIFEGACEALTATHQIKEGDDELAQFGSHFFVVEIKGCKAMTKAMPSNHDGLNNSLGSAFTNLKREFSGLDWEYMLDRRKGELVCDIGITHHPEHPEPLMGLW